MRLCPWGRGKAVAVVWIQYQKHNLVRKVTSAPLLPVDPSAFPEEMVEDKGSYLIVAFGSGPLWPL